MLLLITVTILKIQNMSDQLQMFNSGELKDPILSPSDRLAKILAWLENDLGLTEGIVPSSLMPLTLSGGLDLTFIFGKTLKELTPQMVAQTIGRFNKPLGTLKVIDERNNCLIQHGFYPRIESGYTLSDILQTEVDSKYFLSEKQMQYLIKTTDLTNPGLQTV